ncbi:signal-transducing adaptor protein 1-like isoform X2 [Oncorhynchus nerka]|uniref:signal-transducing adaptor protein 1-like isoform X2 n=1 Tax=Oncorhynchus nerka TaxID=8023 RepID=UPI00112FF0B7|nr:signal-transducing adaptor protein 1-like isoform X2 [Oncorhynchus nerka]
MTATTRRVYMRRETITALPLYYSGQLLKKYTGEKYSEKLDLQMWKSMSMDSPYQNNRSTIYTLTLTNEEVQLKVDNPNTGEEWRGFIMTVATKEIPSKLQLLPGQMLRLEEVLSEEKKRQAPRPPLPYTTYHIHPSSDDTYDDALSGTPLCFFPVSRQKAEKMLKENTEYGSIILRPSTDNTNYAITLRQDYSSGPVMKNYKVLSIDTGFVIELDAPVTVPSLGAVLDHFLKATEFRLHPYLVPQTYDTCIDLPLALPCFPPKTVPRARVAPMIPKGSTPPSFPKLPIKDTDTDTGKEYQDPDEVLNPDPRPEDLN